MRMLLAALGAVSLLAAPIFTAASRADRTSGQVGKPVWTAEPHDHATTADTDHPDSGASLIGKPAPDWRFTRWIGTPLALADLRGKVVLVRWWTEGCHYCATTLPVLDEVRREHADDGL